jgi:chromosome segregation and condensation protein ScpB
VYILQVKARSSSTLEILTSINYSEPISRADYTSQKDIVERQAIEVIELNY